LIEIKRFLLALLQRLINCAEVNSVRVVPASSHSGRTQSLIVSGRRLAAYMTVISRVLVIMIIAVMIVEVVAAAAMMMRMFAVRQMNMRLPTLVRGTRRMRVAYRCQQAGKVSQKRKDVSAAVHN
jgi:hypothetical protein